jgi:mRNA interferase RelE/StbE
MYEVLISHEAEKYYKRLDKNTKQRINQGISHLVEEPLSGFHIKKHWGELEGMHRYAVGDLRIVYEVDAKNKIVKIKAIKGRGEVYKK